MNRNKEYNYLYQHEYDDLFLRNAKIKRIQVHEINQYRSVYGEYHHLFPVLREFPEKFKKYTRMLPNTFDYILSKIEKPLEKNWCNLHTQPILQEERLVVTLRFLITGQSYSNLAFSFRMGESTISTVTKEVMTTLWNELQPLHMPIPSESDFKNISVDFQKRWNLPHCCGSIDCKHLRVKKPPHSKSLYFNWKKYYSVKLQAVVDAFYRFIFIEVGDFGRNHDSTTLQLSLLGRALASNKINFPKDDELPNSTTILPYFLVADGAYKLQEHIIKPYPGKNLPIQKQIFNKRVSRPRTVVECAFGMLCQLWGIFYTTMQHLPETVILIAKTTCILQNVIINLERGFWKHLNGSIKVSEVNAVFAEDEEENYSVVGFGTEVREELMKYVLSNPL